LAHIREGSEHIREGLAKATPEVLVCLTDTLGADTVAELQSGEFTPSRTVGDVMMSCFEEFGPGAEEVIEALDRATPEVLSCIESEIGAERVAQIRRGDREALGEDLEEVFTHCFEEFGGGFGPPEGEFGGLQEAFDQASPEVLGCIQTEIGYDLFVQIRGGDYSNVGPEVSDAFRYCYGQFRQQIPESFNAEEFHEEPPPEAFYEESLPEGFSDYPSDTSTVVPTFDAFTEDCLSGTYGEGYKDRLMSGELTGADIAVAVENCYREEQQKTLEERGIDTYYEEYPESFNGFQGLLTPQALLANPLLLLYYLLLPPR
jgi:hypothetical protein